MKNRSQALEVATLREFDVIVIGGGIVGAGIAQDAASRGLSVLILEKDDFASGTSSRTTKLIHGGLRYLEQLQFNVTRECCQERGLLEQLAPHMVRDFSFILPIKKERRMFAYKAELGLTIYDILSFSVTGSHRHSKINQREVLEHAPALAGSNVVGGLKFHDCITDDSRLVLEVIKSACGDGAQALNYMEVTGLKQENGTVRQVECHDRYSGNEITFHCRSVVNATGVWSDNIVKMLDPNWRPKVQPAKGIHIIVPQSAFETNTALFLPTEDKRYVFVVPWQRALMIGTTDTAYSGVLEEPLPTGDEIDYLLQVTNSYSGQRKLTRNDIIACWAGLRPLIGSPAVEGQEQQGTSKLSREHEILESPGGVIGLIGGKLTNFRLMAGEIVDRLVGKLGHSSTGPITPSRTKRMMLGGWSDKTDFLTATAQIAAKARRLGIEPATLDHLIASYGKDALTIVDLVEHEPSLNQRICPDFPQIMAEVPFSVLNEMAVSLEDLLCRRMRLGVVHQMQCLEAAPKVAKLLQDLLGWDDARTNLELNAIEANLKEHIQCFAAPVLQ